MLLFDNSVKLTIHGVSVSWSVKDRLELYCLLFKNFRQVLNWVQVRWGSGPCHHKFSSLMLLMLLLATQNFCDRPLDGWEQQCQSISVGFCRICLGPGTLPVGIVLTASWSSVVIKATYYITCSVFIHLLIPSRRLFKPFLMEHLLMYCCCHWFFFNWFAIGLVVLLIWSKFSKLNLSICNCVLASGIVLTSNFSFLTSFNCSSCDVTKISSYVIPIQQPFSFI